MTPHLLAVARSEGDGELRCHCGQLLAHRYGSVVVPIGARFWREKDGRQRIECPSCKARITVEKEAA